MTIFTWGFGKYGQLGNGSDVSVEVPCALKIKDSKILDIDCGAHFTACLVEHPASGQRSVLSCGSGKYGRTGLGNEENCSTLKQLTLPKDVSYISCGHWHGGCVSQSGDVYMWGYNKTHGVISDALPPIVPSPVQLCVSPSVRFKYISCGYNFSHAIDENGVCYSWGAGRHGVLGNGNEQDCHVPTAILTISDVKHVSCGYCHVAMVTSTGNLYTFGRNQDGALGHGQDFSNKLVPTQVTSVIGKEITCANCSHGEHHDHTLVCCKDGTAMSCGDGYKGKLGLGDHTSRHTLTTIDPQYFSHQRVIQVSAGGIHSCAVTEGGLVFTWGCGSDGRLGHPEAAGHRYLFRSDVPKLVEGLPKHLKAIKISSSYYHTAVLCSDY